MAALLADGFREDVLWHDAVDEPAATGVAVPASSDVVVVGGGYCGLAAAARLAALGRSVAVLDRGPLGWGASTRNGGMVIPELKAGPRTLERRHGPLGLRLHAEVEAAFDHVEELTGDGGIPCDYRRSGQLLVTHGARGVSALDDLADEHASVGSPARVVVGDELEAEVGSSLFAAGLLVERTGSLHPARFHAGLQERAAAAGASLHPHTEVTALERSTSGWRVATGSGEVSAGEVLLATNAHADGVHPPLRRRVLPMGSFIIATEPLAPALADTVLPTRRMAFNDRNLLWYWRLGPDDRLVFGGRKRLGRVSLAEARDHLYASMLAVHPQLEGVRVERAWGGEVALTLDRLPHCGRLDGVWYATGCNGSGVALSTWMGHRMAEALCGGDLPAFAELAHRPIPLHPARPAWLPLVGAWFARQDAARGS